MPLFFERRSDASSMDVLLSALQLPAIAGVAEREGKAKELMVRAATKPAKLRWGRLLLLVLLLAGLLFAAVTIKNEEAGQALLDCFKIAFAAMMGLFGFEASKNA